MMSSFSIKTSESVLLTKPSSALSKISVSSSVIEPKAICKNWINSLLLFLAAPSAIFIGKETAALRICETSPNFSSEGNLSVTDYISFTNSKLLIHAFKFLCGFMLFSFYISQ